MADTVGPDFGSGGSDTTNGDTGGGDDSSLGGLLAYKDVLTTFAASPAGFILGAILSELLGGIEAIISLFLDAIRFMFVGSDGVPSSTGTLGIADVPVYMASLLGDAGSQLGAAVMTTTQTVTGALVDVAVASGPLAPVVLSMELAVLMVVSAVVLRTLIEIAADVVPGLGGLL